ncbi:unnamed protein product [Gongylonema pulchrum]|uniref:Uncharacterized protein n=1 Tax=Gongylonema pulchrum TaxID=637853 RepID=A0A183DAR6_9BILA|nr:unnamed protein product [Gongylonema pulchrum]
MHFRDINTRGSSPKPLPFGRDGSRSSGALQQQGIRRKRFEEAADPNSGGFRRNGWKKRTSQQRRVWEEGVRGEAADRGSGGLGDSSGTLQQKRYFATAAALKDCW